MIPLHVYRNAAAYIHIAGFSRTKMIPDDKLPERVLKCLSQYRENVKGITFYGEFLDACMNDLAKIPYEGALPLKKETER